MDLHGFLFPIQSLFLLFFFVSFPFVGVFCGTGIAGHGGRKGMAGTAWKAGKGEYGCRFLPMFSLFALQFIALHFAKIVMLPC